MLALVDKQIIPNKSKSIQIVLDSEIHKMMLDNFFGLYIGSGNGFLRGWG
jgi:hypothetical protein